MVTSFWRVDGRVRVNFPSEIRYRHVAGQDLWDYDKENWERDAVQRGTVDRARKGSLPHTFVTSPSLDPAFARECHVVERRCSNGVNATRLGGCRRTDPKIITEVPAQGGGSRDVEMLIP